MKFAIIAALLSCSTAAHSVLIYDVDFSQDTVGLPAATGGGGVPLTRPTQNNFGTSQVLSSFGTLSNQPLQLIPETANSFWYSQYQFNLSAFDTSSILQFDLDLILTNFRPDDDGAPGSRDEDNLTIIFDTPTVVRLELWNAGRIATRLGDIGSFTLGEKFHLTARIDLPANRWKIFKDGIELADQQFFFPFPAHPELPTSIRGIRVNLGDSPAHSGSPIAVIDNLRIESNPVIPEPGTALYGLAILGFLAQVRRSVRRI